MRILFLLLLSFTIKSGFGQETKVVEEKIDFQVIKYTVLKSNPKVKHGKYQAFDYKGKTLELEGYYKNGLKDSIWTTYSYDGKSITSTGTYINDLKTGTWLYKDDAGKKVKYTGNFDHDTTVGVWKYYNFEGELEQIYDFDQDSLLFVKNKTIEQERTIILEGVYKKAIPERDVCYIGGTMKLFEHISKNMKYPRIALEMNIQGKTIIEFKVGTDGTATEFKIKKGFNDECDNEALRVVSLLKNGWIPAMYGGEKVDSYYIIPVSFKIQ